MALAAPCMICSERERAVPVEPFPPLEVVAAVGVGPLVLLLKYFVKIEVGLTRGQRLPVDDNPAQLAPVLLHLGHGSGQAQSLRLCNGR